MEYGYVVKISNKDLYKEIQLPPAAEHFRVGMRTECDVRLYKDDFFENFELDFRWVKDTWRISCSDNIYLDAGDVRKLMTSGLKHGDQFVLRYQKDNYEAASLEFLLDFDNGKKSYACEISLRGQKRLLIGNAKNCDIMLEGAYVRGDILELYKENGTWYLKEKKSQYGVYKDGVKIDSYPAALKDRDFFSVANYHFYYKDDTLYTDQDDVVNRSSLASVRHGGTGVLQYALFNRNSRVKHVLPVTPIEILDPPAKPEKPENNLLLTLLPAVVMLVLTIVIRGFMSSGSHTFVIFSACTMGMGILTSIFSYFQGNKKYKQKVEERETSYREYIRQKKEMIRECRETEREILERIFPDMDANIRMVEEFSGDLFDKTAADDDFLCTRLGTGELEAVRKVNFKNQEKFVSDDELTYLPQQLEKEFHDLHDAPIVLNLKTCNAVGVIGMEEDRDAIAKHLILDLAIHHYFEEVKFAFVMNESQKQKFSWIRLLPHVQDDGAMVRRVACDEESRTILFEHLYKEFSWRLANSKEQSFAHMVVFVLDEMKIKTHPISKFIEAASQIQVTFLFFEKDKEHLPLWCNYLLHMEENKGVLVDTSNENRKHAFTYSPVSGEEAVKLAYRLAPIRCEQINLEGSMAKSITLFEVLDIYNVDDLDLEKRWGGARVERSMAAPLGVKSKNEIVSLDLHEKAHGPHGLVAGTTGSGKSEILQSYILSMATLYHPYEVGFLIIDFKGGGMANQFQRLPHMLGSITNIDGNEIQRSLLSIKAELLKRQDFFARAEVNHIDKYILKFRNHEVEKPLPHLIIIVDEFAELKAEFPDFMKELISAARIGRSLGVHLILATQKPSGQVNEQIWSNSRFKLCLKVQTPEDSNEMIKSPLAAEIIEPGRAYFQVGNNEIFELFQSGFSGASEKMLSNTYAEKEYEIYRVDLSGKRESIYKKKKEKEEKKNRTQLEAIVSYVEQYCAQQRIQPLDHICMPSLPKVLNYPGSTENGDAVETTVAIGMLDDPNRQRQDTAYLNLSVENTMVIGASQYGKTNLLQTVIRGIAEKYTPREVTLYILDFGSMALKNFESLQHVGGVVCANDDERFKNLFKLLLAEIVLRKEKLVQEGVSSFVSYREMGKKDLPQIVLLIDNYTAVKELYLQEEDPLLTVCREGIAVGISVVLCNQQTTGLGFRYMSAFAKRIALYCNESSEYSGVIERCRIVPANVAGRAVTEIQKNIYEMQTYLSFAGEKEIERVKQMRAFIQEANARNAGMYARKIPEIPVILEEASFVQEYGVQRENTYTVPVGLDYEGISVMNIDLLQVGAFAMAGKAQQEKINLLSVLFGQLYRNMFTCPADVYLLDGMSHALRPFKDYGFVKAYSIDADDLVAYVEEIYEAAQERYEAVTKEEADLEEEPLLFVVVQNELAIETLCKNPGALKKYKELLGRLKTMKVCFLYADVENVTIPYSAPEILKDLKEKKNFYFFDDLQNLKICDISAATVRRFQKKLTPGDGYWLNGNEIYKMKMVKAER